MFYDNQLKAQGHLKFLHVTEFMSGSKEQQFTQKILKYNVAWYYI